MTDLALDDLADFADLTEEEAEAVAVATSGDNSSIFSDLALDRRFLPSTLGVMDDAVSATRMMSGDDIFIIFDEYCSNDEMIIYVSNLKRGQQRCV